MCSCITFCWTRQLSNTTLIGPLAFGGRELCVLVLHSAWTRQLLNSILIGHMAFREQELCVIVLHSAGLRQLFKTTLHWSNGI